MGKKNFWESPADAAGNMEDASGLIPVYNSARHMANLFDQDNGVAAKLEARKSGFVLACEVGGGIVGGTLGAPAGSAGTPIGAYIGSELAGSACDNLVHKLDDLRIYRQYDDAGHQWRFNGHYWSRPAFVDTTDDDDDNPEADRISANPDTTRLLNKKASDTAISLRLAELPHPTTPFTQPARADDAYSLEPAPWRRQDDGQWQRGVVIGYGGLDGNLPEMQIHQADPQRAQQLDQMAADTTAANIVNGSVGLAMRYAQVHQQLGWNQLGDLPEAINTALHDPSRILASDGRVYVRHEEGIWLRQSHEHPDRSVAATGNIALELELAHDARQQAAARHSQILADLPPYQAPSAEQQQRVAVEAIYRNNGNAITPETLEAAVVAVNHTRSRLGLHDTGLYLLPDEHGQRTAASAIQHFIWAPNDSLVNVGITSQEDIERARNSTLELHPATPATSASQAQTAPVDLDHAREHPLCKLLAGHIPAGLGPDKALEGVAACRQAGITSPAQVDQVTIHNGKLFITGPYPGCRAYIDLETPPPNSRQLHDDLSRPLPWEQAQQQERDRQASQEAPACTGIQR